MFAPSVGGQIQTLCFHTQYSWYQYCFRLRIWTVLLGVIVSREVIFGTGTSLSEVKKCNSLPYTGWSKNLCAPDDYNTEYYLTQSDCLAADRQGQGDTRLTLSPSVIPNSNYVSDWNCLKYFCFFFFGAVIFRYRSFLITLYLFQWKN
jgi:hypothetical protein